MLRRTTRLLLVAFALVTLAGVARAQDRAQEVLAQARKAVGIDTVATKMTTFAAKAAVKTSVPQVNMELAADVDVEFILPDKYRKVQSLSIGGMNIQATTGVNGDKIIFDDGGRTAAMGMDITTGPLAQEMLQGFKNENIYLQAILLLSPPTSPAFITAYAGEAEAPDGKADAVDIKGPNNFLLRLFFDKQTRRLLMATYSVESPDISTTQMQDLQKKMQTEYAGNPQGALKAMGEFMTKAPRKTVTTQLHFSDYKKVDGVFFPHHMNIDRQGAAAASVTQGATEDWTFSTFKVNPPLKPEKFQTK